MPTGPSSVTTAAERPERLQRHLRGIFAHRRYPRHTSLPEGINNRIRVLKRMTCG